jgi:hypothetical protein
MKTYIAVGRLCRHIALGRLCHIAVGGLCHIADGGLCHIELPFLLICFFSLSKRVEICAEFLLFLNHSLLRTTCI